MANKHIKDLRNLSKDELKKKERELQSQLFQAKMKHATAQLENTGSLWMMRKQLARVKTLLSTTAKKA